MSYLTTHEQRSESVLERYTWDWRVVGPYCLQYSLPKNISGRQEQITKVITGGISFNLIENYHIAWHIIKPTLVDTGIYLSEF